MPMFQQELRPHKVNFLFLVLKITSLFFYVVVVVVVVVPKPKLKKNGVQAAKCIVEGTRLMQTIVYLRSQIGW